MVAPLKGEIKVVVSVLEQADDSEDDLTLDDVAKDIIVALDEYRSRKPSFTIVARVSMDGGETWQFFTYGPFKSRAIAKEQSGKLFPAGSMTSVKWLIMENVKDFKTQVLEDFKARNAQASAWDKGDVPVSLIRVTEWLEPVTGEEGGDDEQEV